VLDIRQSAQQDANFWQGALGKTLKPYQQAWNEGRPAEALGRGAFEVTSMFLGGGAAGKAGKVSQVADAAGDLGRVANVADTASDLSRVGRVADAAGDLSCVGRGAGLMDNLGGLGDMLQRGKGALGGIFDNVGGLLQRGRGALGGMFDDAGGLLQRGRQTVGGVFDNIVGLPQQFRQWSGNTFQGALQRGRGVFGNMSEATQKLWQRAFGKADDGVSGGLRSTTDDLGRVPDGSLRQNGAGYLTGSADEAYDTIRGSNTDVAAIAQNTGIKPSNIQKVKDHLFYEDHLLDRYVDYGVPAEMSRFDSDIAIANSWKRLENGTFTPDDIQLLRHEAAEASLMRRWNDQSYTRAHDRAQKRFPAPELNE
jgi:hypothetical protein